MAFGHSLAEYQRSMMWTHYELLEIAHDDIARWLKLLAYGTAPPTSTELPTFYRTSNLEQAFFVPNKHVSWDV
jgi:hypothetical protein